MMSFCYDTSLKRWQKTDVIQKNKRKKSELVQLFSSS